MQYIREDLSNYIKAHDFDPIMFEDGDIGYTPGKPLDKSCYDTMKNSDMVLLIIGGLYGSPATGETKDEFKEYMSVTRNEFRTAVEAGIPVFAFIDTKVFSEYAVYETNVKVIEEQKIPIKFSATKDINIFRFIREIKGIGKKVLGENDNVKYSDVVEEIEILRTCEILAEHLKVKGFELENKEENINKYLEGVKVLINEILSIGKDFNEQEDYAGVHHVYAKHMLESGANGCSSHVAIVREVDALKNLLESEVYEKVKTKLLDMKYYSKIFE